MFMYQILDDKILPTNEFIIYIEKSFIDDKNVYNVLLLILFNKYNLNRIIKKIIIKNNVDLLENILSNDYNVELIFMTLNK